MEFTINLLHRFRLGKCKVCLKSLSISRRIYNVYEEKELSWAFQMGVNGIPSNKIEWQKLRPGYYTVEGVTKRIQQYIDKIGGLVKIFYNVKRKRVQMKCINGEKDIEVYLIDFNDNSF